MSFWRRLFNADLRRAEAAEAAGDLRAAARGYAAAEVPEALARVQRRLAADAAPAEAVALLRAAQDAEPTDAGARQLAEALLALAPRQSEDAAAASRLEAGALLEQLGDDAAAASAYEAAGAWQDAADSYAEIGDIDAVERVVATGAAQDVAQLTEEGLRERILAVAAAGRADDALATLERAQATLPDSVALAGVAEAFSARLPPSGTLPLPRKRLFNGSELVIGREGLLSAAVRGLRPRHAVLRRDGAALIVEGDVARRLEGRAEVELCVGCTLRLRPVPHGWSATLTVRGLAGAPIWWVDRYRFADGTELQADGRWWRDGDRILLVGDVVAGQRVG